MRRDSVSSSSIAEAGYDAGSETLEILFTNGTTYQYYNVPEAVYTEFMSAPSKGVFFNSQIRNRFPHGRV